MIGLLALWHKHLHVGCIICSCQSLSASVWPCRSTKISPVVDTEFTFDPGTQHLGNIHSWQPPNEPWGL